MVYGAKKHLIEQHPKYRRNTVFLIIKRVILLAKGKKESATENNPMTSFHH